MSHVEKLQFKSLIPAPVEEVFAWHERPGAFERLSPPWVRVEVLERSGDIRDGHVVLRISQGPVSAKCYVQHRDFIQNLQFCDSQLEGPFTQFDHQHKFVANSEDSMYMEDSVEYQLGMAAELLGNLVFNNELERLFRYRHQVLADDFKFAKADKGAKPMKVALTGSTGLIGSALIPLLTTQGHSVLRLVRPQSSQSGAAIGESVVWNPSAGELNAAALEGCDAIVHLAGDSIGDSRWDDEKKKRLRSSRLDSTKLICDRIAEMKAPPKVFACASAIGYYGDRGSETMTEDSQVGRGFLAELCNEWEATARGAEKAGVRVACLRFGVVMSPRGGALQKMMLPFKMGAGGPIGSGQQYFSWVAVDDAAGAILHTLATESLNGPVNIVAPNTVTNAEFAHAFGRVIQRPTFMPMPAFAARLAFGEFADECLLAGQKVLPNKLKNTGYQFRYPEIEAALRHLLGREPATASSAR